MVCRENHWYSGVPQPKLLPTILQLYPFLTISQGCILLLTLPTTLPGILRIMRNLCSNIRPPRLLVSTMYGFPTILTMLLAIFQCITGTILMTIAVCGTNLLFLQPPSSPMHLTPMIPAVILPWISQIRR